jgi:hypothetical protein
MLLHVYCLALVLVRCLVGAQTGFWSTPPGNSAAPETVETPTYYIGDTLPLAFSTTLHSYTISLIQTNGDSNGFAVHG